MDADSLSHEVVKEALESVAVKEVDYYVIDHTELMMHTPVMYSKHCKGGSYTLAFRYLNIGSNLIIRPLIYGSPFGFKYDDPVEVSLVNPESFGVINKTIRGIFDRLQTGRRKTTWWKPMDAETPSGRMNQVAHEYGRVWGDGHFFPADDNR